MANPDLVALAPLVESVSTRVAGGDLLSGPTHVAARTAYEALVGDADSVVLRIADAAAVVTAVLTVVAPERAPVSGDVSVTLAEIGGQGFSSAAVSVARTVGVLAWLLPLLAHSAICSRSSTSSTDCGEPRRVPNSRRRRLAAATAFAARGRRSG